MLLPRRAALRGLLPVFFLFLAVVQLTVFVRPIDPVARGRRFLYGRDTLAHDAVVQLWIQQRSAEDPLRIPLWMPELQGGLPTIGAFLWTPLAPQAWPFLLLPFPEAQVLAWILCLAIAGCGAALAARALGACYAGAAVAGTAWMLSGHVVTLIHAGHFQKVMALAWLPWMIAGALMIARARSAGLRLRGAVWVSGGLALMVLCGHPQIAYLGILLSGILWILFSTGRRLSGLLPFFGALLIGLITAGPQLIPGREMGPLSNRAAGVDYTEAVATSYPPGEVGEFLIPRIKGSSVFGDVYTGDWGERIVSDYAGLMFLLLAAVGVLLPRRKAPLLLLIPVVFFLLIGFGRYFHLYRFLYEFVPGFSTFRSPGTFMAGTALSLALMAGMGFSALGRFVRPRINPAWILVPTLLFGGLDLMRANRHFLFSFPWEKYKREFLAPNFLDLWLMEEDKGWHFHDAVSEQSLRPILFGRRSLLGYHPISYAALMDGEMFPSPGTGEWLNAHGVYWLGAPLGSPGAVAGFPDAGRSVLGVADRLEGRPRRVLPWRTNEMRFELFRGMGEPNKLYGAFPPGMHLRWSDESTAERLAKMRISVWAKGRPSDQPVLLTATYRPRSWLVGLFFGALGLGVLAFQLGYSKRAVPTRTMVAPSSMATSKSPVMPIESSGSG